MMLSIRNSALLAALTAIACVSVSMVAPPEAGARSHFAKGTQEPADKNFKQGMDLLKKGNYEAAIDSFMQAAYFSRNGYNPEAYKYLGLCYKAVRNYPKAIEAFNKHLSQTTEPAPDVRIDLAESYMDTGQWDKAREQIDKSWSEQNGTGVWRQRFAMGELQEKMAAATNGAEGSLGDAEGFYESAISEKPHYTEAWMGKARIQIKTEHWNEALSSYRHILDEGPLMHPDLTELYYGMGTCLLKRGDHQGALDHWHMALENNPDCFDAHLAIANLLFDEKHFASAQKEYESAMRTMPPYSSAKMQKDAIQRRLLWIEQAVKPKDAPVVIKPSPSMRMEFDEAARAQNQQMQGPPPKGDTGF